MESAGGRWEFLGVEELGVELVEVGWGELLEGDGADVGGDVESDLLFVAAPGGGFEVGAAGGEPFVGEADLPGAGSTYPSTYPGVIDRRSTGTCRSFYVSSLCWLVGWLDGSMCQVFVGWLVGWLDGWCWVRETER